MFATQRLNAVFQSAKKIKINDQTKIIIFSDCHRGDYGWSDDFAKNRNIFYYALSFYFNEGYTYIELGDGDELWKNRYFSELFKAHQQVYELMSRFYMQDRFHMVFGNHDIERSIPAYVKNTLYHYFDENIQQKRPLFPDIKPLAGIRLCYTPLEQGTLFGARAPGGSGFGYFMAVWTINGASGMAKPAIIRIKRPDQCRKKLHQSGACR